MPKYRIFAGLGGGFGSGFGGATEHAIEEHDNEGKAMEAAEQYAREVYDSYAGLHGLLDWDEVAEEHGLTPDEDDEEITQAYAEEQDSWLDYHVELVND